MGCGLIFFLLALALLNSERIVETPERLERRTDSVISWVKQKDLELPGDEIVSSIFEEKQINTDFLKTFDGLYQHDPWLDSVTKWC